MESELATRAVVAPFPVPVATLVSVQRRRRGERWRIGSARAGSIVGATPVHVRVRWWEWEGVSAGAGRIAGVKFADVQIESCCNLPVWYWVGLCIVKW